MTSEDTVRVEYRRAPRQYFVAMIGFLVAVNVLTFLYHLTSAVVFNALSDAVSIGLVIYSVHALLSVSGRVDASSRLVVWATALAGLSFLANLTVASPIATIKYLAVYIFYAAGRAWPGRPRAAETSGIYVLAALPIVFMLIGTSRVYPPQSVAYLPNANTAALYFSSVLFALAPQLHNGALVLQFVNAALMDKVGAAVATLAAIAIWLMLPVRKGSVIVGLTVAIGLLTVSVVAYFAGALDRLVTAYQNVMLIIELEPATVAAMPYKELVELTGTTDLSAFFRVIHWANIWSLYTSQGFLTILFGYGAGQSRFLTYAQLAPHNDYLRVLAEYGLMNLIVFIAFLFHVVARIRPMQARILFIVLMIYMVSENLLDNFTSMALYFAYAGRMTVSEMRFVPWGRDRLIDDDHVSPAPA